MDMANVKEKLKKKVEERCKELEYKNNELTKQVSGQNTLIGVKHLIWDMIIVEETKVRPYLDFIQDKENTVQEAKKHILVAKLDLHKKPLDTTKSTINFLRNLTDEDIKWGNIWDRIQVITLARNLVHKYLHLKMVEVKWSFTREQAGDFVAMFKHVVQRGIYFF